MLATTTSVSARAISSKRRCPACKAPMVGTRPTVSPAARRGASSLRSFAISFTNPATSSAIAAGFQSGGRFDIFHEGARGVGDHGIEVGVFLYERRRLGGETEQVVTHQHLPVTIGAGADSNGGDAQAAADLSREVVWDAFKDHSAGAGVFERLRVLEQDVGGFLGGRLALESAELADRLWQQSQMPHHRDADGNQALHSLDHGPAAFKLHGHRAAFLH